jgi:ubiquinone/menaquinone biosynthesis C-methylase UbiE
MTIDLPRPRHRWFAALYDKFDRVSESRTRELRPRLLRGLSGRVLELGCGTGKNFEYYDWATIDSLDATEPDPFMLRYARQKHALMDGLARAKVTLTEAPAESLPFEDESFDVVVSCLVLCTVVDPAQSLSEARRVLKNGGELRLLEHVAAEGRWRKVQDAIQPVYGWLSAGCRLDRRTEDLVQAAGFELDIWERPRFSRLHPAIMGVARK